MKSRNRKTIEVVVSPAGEIIIEAEGYSGNTCEEATRFLEDALGVPARRTRKAEFYRRRPRTTNRQEIRP